jgi:hypothetical protein|tara:strand:+ start:375 stop:851 length:477 start_codon:yes stop_codon:yes gene_type:complete
MRLVEAGALRPLVAMMSVHAQPRHYAGLALLKLADNFESHQQIAQEGGIQALLRLARARSTDEELQYKSALTVGHLASNAVKLLSGGGAKSGGGGSGGKKTRKSSSSSGGGSSTPKLPKLQRSTAQQRTSDYLESTVAKARKGGSRGNDGSGGQGGLP